MTGAPNRLWSSATISDVTQLTAFLKANDDLKPFEIKAILYWMFRAAEKQS